MSTAAIIWPRADLAVLGSDVYENGFRVGSHGEQVGCNSHGIGHRAALPDVATRGIC